MARVPEVIRKRAVSNVAAEPPQAGQGFAALSELARLGAEFIEPAAEKEAQEAGFDAVYRDENGQLQVDERSPFGGKYADIHNAAAFSSYLSQRSIDMSESFTELARKYEFDPAGFKDAAESYVKLLEEDETIPRALKEDLLANARTETSRRFNGLFNQATKRTERESDRNTAAHRDMAVDDFINLTAAGNEEAADAKWEEITQISSFRANAPYISETPAEAEAYLRGARGAAKAATIQRSLTDLSGATELSDEQRQELMSALDDPDLSPADRSRLYTAAQGRLKGIDANAIVDSLTSDSYDAKVVIAESGGKASAQNPNSSATGHHQFIESTWLETVKSLKASGGAKWAEGLGRAELLEMRKDPAASSEVFQHFRSNNAAVLQSNGLPVNDTTEYMAHFFGAGGAVKVLSADPNTLVSDILPAGVIEANEFLEGKSAAWAKDWAARKMTVKASDLAAQQTKIDQIEDSEVRAMASRELGRLISVKKRLEDAAAVEYRERLSADDDTLTEQEIKQDHNISDAAQDALVSELRKQRKDQLDVQQTINQALDPAHIFDPFDSKQRGRINDAYNFLLDGEDPLSDSGFAAAGEFAMNTGIAPKSWFNAIRGATNSGDPNRVTMALEQLNQIDERFPGAIEMYDGKSQLRDMLSDYATLSQYMAGDAAAQRIIENNSPEFRAKLRNQTDAAKAASKNLEIGDFLKFLSNRGLSPEVPLWENQEASIMVDFQRLFREQYIRTGDETLAKNRAMSELSRIVGPNTISGNRGLMRHPPQQTYASHAWSRDTGFMQRQLEQAVSEMAFGEDANSSFELFQSGRVSGVPRAAKSRKWIDSDRIVLVSDYQTRQEVAATGFDNSVLPSYTVMYFDQDDVIHALPGRFYFAPPSDEEQAARVEATLADMDAKRQRETGVVNMRVWIQHLQDAQGMTLRQAQDEVISNKDKYRGAPPES